MRIEGSNRRLSLHWTSLAEGNANFSIVIVFRYADDLMVGRLTLEEDAVREALSLWEGRERCRMELLASLDEAEADIAEGRFTDYTDEMLPQLAEELKREARALRA